MPKMPRTDRKVKSQSAADWPSWTDEDRWFPIEPTGPTEADDAEHASWNQDGHAEDGPAPDDPIWDQWAEEAAQQDRMDAGFCPF